MERRQVGVAVPYNLFDPRGRRDVRFAAGTGLWDAGTNSYLVPGATASSTQPGGAGALAAPPAFFNVAFRYRQTAGAFRTNEQAAALNAGDISAYHATVDFVKMVAGADDDMPDAPTGVPTQGWMNRIFASHYEPQQGRIAVGLRANLCADRPCPPAYAGRLQPYSLYVPAQRMAESGYPLTFDLHALGGNHNSGFNAARQSALGERGSGSLVVQALARGTDQWYCGSGLAEVFEVWADVARNYKLDNTRVYSSGFSMGGFGTFKLAMLFPDLFAAIAPDAACPTAGVSMTPTNFPGGRATLVRDHLDSLRHVPTSYWVGSTDTVCHFVNGQRPIGDRMDELGYEYDFRTFIGMGHSTANTVGQANFLGMRTVVQNPSQITYVRNPDADEPQFGIVANHVYWLSDIAVRDAQRDPPIGTIDVRSHGFGEGPAQTQPRQDISATDPLLSTFPYSSEQRAAPTRSPAPAENRIDITARNIASITIDPIRAKVKCDAAINIDSDGPLVVKLAGCP